MAGLRLADGQHAAPPMPMCWPRRCTARANCCRDALRRYPLFDNLWRLKSTPVMNVQLWFDALYSGRGRQSLFHRRCAVLGVRRPGRDQRRAGYDRHGGSLVSMCVAPAAPLWRYSDAEIAEHAGRR